MSESFIMATAEGDRPMTENEIEAYLADREAARIEREALQAAAIAKETAKQSALTKLAALGLTETEAKTILGM